MKVKGAVIPITKNKAKLSVLLSNGKLIEGETKIDRADLQSSEIKKIFYKNAVKLNENAKRTIEEADYIIFGPGDYYTSIIPNIIVNDFKKIILGSKAKIILPINLTNKKGHTIHWRVSDYVRIIELYLGKPVDFVLINNEAPSKEQVELYKLEEGDGVLIEDDFDDKRVIRESLLSHAFFANDKADTLEDSRSFIRHDSEKLAKCINKIIT